MLFPEFSVSPSGSYNLQILLLIDYLTDCSNKFQRTRPINQHKKTYDVLYESSKLKGVSDDPFKRPVRKDSNPYTRIRHIGSPPNNITNVQITPPAYQTGTPTGSVPGIPVALGSTMGPTITQRVKYDEWLKVEVCREFQRDKCNRKPVSMSHLIVNHEK